MMDIEEKLREILLPVFGLNSTKEIQPESSFVNDLGADSIDFVEIIYLIESNFGVVIKINEIISGTIKINPDDLFTDGLLTEEGASLIHENLPESTDRFRAGLTKKDIFSILTVRDLSNLIKVKKSHGE
jgi:acyl carrier protein